MKRRLCRLCHRPSGELAVCKSCEVTTEYHKIVEALRIAKLRKQGWIAPKVETIRNKK